jgi:hypothetical protein
MEKRLKVAPVSEPNGQADLISIYNLFFLKDAFSKFETASTDFQISHSQHLLMFRNREDQYLARAWSERSGFKFFVNFLLTFKDICEYI